MEAVWCMLISKVAHRIQNSIWKKIYSRYERLLKCNIYIRTIASRKSLVRCKSIQEFSIFSYLISICIGNSHSMSTDWFPVVNGFFHLSIYHTVNSILVNHWFIARNNQFYYESNVHVSQRNWHRSHIPWNSESCQIDRKSCIKLLNNSSIFEPFHSLCVFRCSTLLPAHINFLGAFIEF